MSDTELFFVGTYTKKEGHVPKGCGEGIVAYMLDKKTGSLVKKSVLSSIINPTYVHYDAKTQKLYTVEEITHENPESAFLIVYDVNESDGKLTEVSRANTRLVAGAHVNVYAKNVLIAAYGSGNIVAYSTNDGHLGTKGMYQYTGDGPNKQRQEAPHAHQAIVSPNGKFMYVCDLGTDTIWVHSTSDLPEINQPVHVISTPPGSGPRHMVFHPSLPFAYSIMELTGIILTFAYNSESGLLNVVNEVNSLPAEYDGLPSSSGIRIHPSGDALYISNRTHDSIGIFPLAEGKIDAKNASWIACGGECPRDFAIDSDGKFLICGNQDESTLTVFKIGAADQIDANYGTFPCNTPSCVAFATSNP